ncbi:MAG: NfeD family protein [Ruminococcus sp.]|nr:NfeD family protein [Ruminococcus sp.]
MDVLIWAILLVIFVIIEVITIQLVSIWLAAASFITMLCAFFFDISMLAQLGIFTLSSIIMLAVTMPFLRKNLNKGHIATNAELDVGKSAVVIEEINPAINTGRVSLNGVDWSAISENGRIIPKNSIVTVMEVKGAKLIVEIKD